MAGKACWYISTAAAGTACVMGQSVGGHTTFGVYCAWLCSVCLHYILAFLWLVRLAGGATAGLRALYEFPFQLLTPAPSEYSGGIP